jgi:hypothetical protein
MQTRDEAERYIFSMVPTAGAQWATAYGLILIAHELRHLHQTLAAPAGDGVLEAAGLVDKMAHELRLARESSATGPGDPRSRPGES